MRTKAGNWILPKLRELSQRSCRRCFKLQTGKTLKNITTRYMVQSMGNTQNKRVFELGMQDGIKKMGFPVRKQ